MTEQRGKYIVLEGHDATGKTSQVEPLRQKLAERGIESIEFHEPDGVPIAGEIRTIIKNGSLARTALTDVLLFSAARRENWQQAGKTALENGTWIVSARNFISTLAYQSYGDGIDQAVIYDLTKLATDEDYMKPDLTVLLSLDDEAERSRRIAERGALDNPDTFESRADDFQERVRTGYLQIARDMDLPIIVAAQTPEKVSDDIWSYVKPLL